MRILPILIEQEPTREGWENLSAAREALGYREKIKPARALPGSPEPILAVGKYPDWLTSFAYVHSLGEVDALEEALKLALSEPEREEVEQMYETLLSRWMDADVKYVGEEDYDGGVQFVG